MHLSPQLEVTVWNFGIWNFNDLFSCSDTTADPD